MKVNQVPDSWYNNMPAKSHTRSFTTDGHALYSYDLMIGTTNTRGEKVLYRYTREANNFISRTTSRHVSLATSYADSVLTPNIVNQIAIEPLHQKKETINSTKKQVLNY
jgi:hypothetical protein